MQFSNVLAQKTSSPEIAEKYFTCLIEEGFVTLAIWGVVNEKPKVLNIGTPKEWQELSSLGDSIELGLEEFHAEAEGVTKVLFSLPQEWVNGADIKAEYKEILKKTTQKLVLEPVGFVVTLEALFHYVFQYKTSAARTIYLQVCANEYRLYFTENGQLIQKEQVGRSDQFTDDLVEGLSRIQKQPLPAQMYFFSFEVPMDQLEQDKQTFLAYDWDSTKLFHHLPSIDILSRADMVEAACISGGGETLLSHTAPKTRNDTPAKSDSSLDRIEVTSEEEDFGFESLKKDEAAEKAGPAEPTAPDETAESESKVSSFGIPMPQKVVKSILPPEPETEPEYAIDASLIDQADEEEEEGESKSGLKLSLPRLALPTFSLPSIPLLNRTSNLNGIEPRNKTKKFLIPAIAILALLVVLVGGVYGLIFLQRTAEVEIVLNTVPISVDAQVALDPDIPETDANNKILKVQIVEKEMTDTHETSTTGSKIIGEKASGTVTILNKTNSLKTFAKGTEIKAGNKVFLTDEEVTVASSSTQENSNGQTVVYGKKDVKVIAKEIGADSNLDKETEFTVGNFGKDTYAARNEKAMSGGSSREIQAVSTEDQRKLAESLKKSLIEEAEKALKAELSEGDYLVLSGNVKVVEQNYSAKVGDETERLTLTMTLSVEGYSYKASDLKPIAREQLTTLVPDGGALIEDKINILSRQSESENASDSAKLSLEATLTAEYTPPTDSEQWLSEIKGKTIEQAHQALSSKSEIKSNTIRLHPRLAAFLVARLPTDEKKIDIKKKVE